ncbi:agmatinase [Bacteroidia bacterium]|nr:agmatinase [Bacteroidia bacterium]
MYDPNGIGLPNGNFFGFPYSIEESDLILLSVPWDVTTSCRRGAALAPKAILNASLQLDFFDFDVPEAWLKKIATEPINPQITAANTTYRAVSEHVIHQLESWLQPEPDDLSKVNNACEVVNNYVFKTCQNYLQQGKTIGLVGGDHSTPLGLIQALCEVHDHFGILHLDAHADLREAYEGFTYSHASIMHNVLLLKNVQTLVQVGLRDVSPNEMHRIENDDRIVCFSDYALKNGTFTGYSWQEQCQTIIQALPEKVYISFDIDALSPENCPHTGTPVPGGLSFYEAVFLLNTLKKNGKTIIGFDLCEVAPTPNDEWDANVGARILYKLAVQTLS